MNIYWSQFLNKDAYYVMYRHINSSSDKLVGLFDTLSVKTNYTSFLAGNTPSLRDTPLSEGNFQCEVDHVHHINHTNHSSDKWHGHFDTLSVTREE